MRQSLGFFALILSFPVLAIDWTPRNERDIYDLMYLPKKGTIAGQTTYQYQSILMDVEVNTVDVGEIENKSHAAAQELGYSLSDRLFVGAGIDYLIDADAKFKSNSPGIASTESDADGFGDPKFMARFRILDQVEMPVNLDVIVDYQFSSGPSKASSAQGNSDNQHGGDVSGLGLEFGEKFTDFQFVAHAKVQRYYKVKSKDVLEKTTTEDEAHNSFELSGKVQRNLNEQWILTGGLMLGFMGAYKSKEQATNEFVKYPSMTLIAWSAEVMYLLNPNLALIGGFTRGGVNDFEAKNETNTKVNFEENTITMLNLGARYQF